MNWLDYVLLAIVAVAAVLGIVKGFVKQVIGLVAVVAGLVLASLYYGPAGDVFAALVDSRLLANFLGFLLIFVAVLVAGAIVGHVVHKAMVGPLALVNRLFGGLFGLVKAVLICGVLVFALVSFEVARPAVQGSALAPACLGITRGLVNMIPQDLRAKFNSSYKEIRDSGGKNGQKI